MCGGMGEGIWRNDVIGQQTANNAPSRFGNNYLCKIIARAILAWAPYDFKRQTPTSFPCRSPPRGRIYTHWLTRVRLDWVRSRFPSSVPSVNNIVQFPPSKRLQTPYFWKINRESGRRFVMPRLRSPGLDSHMKSSGMLVGEFCFGP